MSTRATAYAQSLIKEYNIDVTIICETKFETRMDASNLAESLNGRIWTVDAPQTLTGGGKVCGQNHGVCVIVHDPEITVILGEENPLGLLCLTLKRRNARPFLLIATYLPPTKKGMNNDRRKTLMLHIDDILSREKRLHGGFAVVGDINVQIGPYGGRLSTLSPVHHTEFINKILGPHDCSPVDGRLELAEPTSSSWKNKSPGQVKPPTAEATYIIVPTDARAIAIPNIEYPHVHGWHRPRIAIVGLIPEDEAEPVPPKRVLPPQPPAYSDPLWTQSFESRNEEVRAIERAARNGEPVHILYAMLTRVCVAPKEGHNPASQPAPTHKYRRYRGNALPAESVVLHQAARDLLSTSNKSGDAIEKLVLKARAKRMRTRADELAQRARALGIMAHAKRLNEGRLLDSRKLYRDIRDTAPGSSRPRTEERPERASPTRLPKTLQKAPYRPG